MDWGKQIVAGFVGVYAAMKAGSLVKGLAGAVGIGGGGGAGGAGAAKASGKLLNGIGKGAGGIIGGVGKAFASLGSPAIAGQVVLGAGALGLAFAALIAGVGGGIAAATALINLTLPKFVENLKAFETIDSSSLTVLGSSLMDLGAGLGAMSSGAMSGAAGSVMSSIFGNDTLDNMAMFSKVGPELAPGLNELGNAMIKVGPGFEMFGKGLDSISNYDSDGLTRFTDDIDQLINAMFRLSVMKPISVGNGDVSVGPSKIMNVTRTSTKATLTNELPGAETPSAKPNTPGLESTAEINTLLQKQLEVLHVIAGSSIAQVDSIKAIKFNEVDY